MRKKVQKCPFHVLHNTPLELTQNLDTQDKHDKVGVILVNLGTPDDTSWGAVRRYLKEFLTDRRVINMCPFLWKMILNTIILTFRPSKTAAVYKSVWKTDTDESPIRYYTRQQAKLVADRLKDHDNVIVDWAMRYGTPSIETVVHRLHDQGCTRLVVLPLYPQYAASTSATVNDQVFRTLMRMRWQPTVRIVHPYETHDRYITALKNSILAHLKTLDWTPEKIMVSFHGIPLDYVERGDPYKYFCEKTFAALEKAMPNTTPELMLTFQSRFGPKEWLQPYTDESIKQLASAGIKKLAIMAPGFASDCIETLEELSIEGQKDFKEHGGTHFTQIPCLNDSPDAIELYETLIRENLVGWSNAFPKTETETEKVTTSA